MTRDELIAFVGMQAERITRQDAGRGLIHEANLAREQNRPGIDPAVRDELLYRLHHGVLVGLSDTTSAGSRPGERKARLLLEVFRDRRAEVLGFVDDLRVPPTSNQAERDLRPAVNPAEHLRAAHQRATHQRPLQNPRLRVQCRENGLDKMPVLREAILGRPWTPDLPAPT
jgi:transposase